jgi:adenine-specific DNA-methyltransferase
MCPPSLLNENFVKLAALFPNAVTETIVDDKVVRTIDADVLRQEISAAVVEGKEERYQFTWPDKKKSVLLANSPIAATLRPSREESVDFDNTENLYIEGDNLDVLKVLQETYLNRVKMIYIDPPYNTGNDFILDNLSILIEYGIPSETVIKLEPSIPRDLSEDDVIQYIKTHKIELFTSFMQYEKDRLEQCL